MYTCLCDICISDDGCIWAVPPLVSILYLFFHSYEYFYNQIILYRMHF